ncbi:MAG: hypothetical protein JXB14_00225 [Candidatus Altiarchaeota archaeon]|nr:hypothetical protein [Candidatus Altiarchaeota archaeon]
MKPKRTPHRIYPPKGRPPTSREQLRDAVGRYRLERDKMTRGKTVDQLSQAEVMKLKRLNTAIALLNSREGTMP